MTFVNEHEIVSMDHRKPALQIWLRKAAHNIFQNKPKVALHFSVASWEAHEEIV